MAEQTVSNAASNTTHQSMMLTVKVWLALQVGIFGCGIAAVQYWNSGIVCAGVAVIPSIYLLALVWTSTLDAHCPLWPLQASSFIVWVTWVHAFFTSRFEIVEIPDEIGFYGIQIFNLIAVAIIMLLAYTSLAKFRTCFQKIYGARLLLVAFTMTKEFIAVFPIILYFTLEVAFAVSEFAVSDEIYAKHTPFCVHTPNDLGELNTAYRCEQDPTNPDPYARTGHGRHILGHSWSGIASRAVFLSPTAHIETFALATERAAVLDASLLEPGVTASLHEHDYQRFQAVDDYEELVVAGLVNGIHAVIFIASLIATQVLGRASRTSMGDAVQGRVTKAEFCAYWCSGLAGLMALGANSMRRKELTSQAVMILLVATVVVILIQWGCLVKVCRDIDHGAHAFLPVRAPRPSSLPRQSVAVAPQPIEAASGGSSTNSSVDLRPAAAAAPGPNATIECLSNRKQQEELSKVTSMLGKIEEKHAEELGAMRAHLEKLEACACFEREGLRRREGANVQTTEL
jgi:hypothetical protein